MTSRDHEPASIKHSKPQDEAAPLALHITPISKQKHKQKYFKLRFPKLMPSSQTVCYCFCLDYFHLGCVFLTEGQALVFVYLLSASSTYKS